MALKIAYLQHVITAKESNQKDCLFVFNSVMVNSSLGNHLELLLDILKIVIILLWVLVLMFSVNDS